MADASKLVKIKAALDANPGTYSGLSDSAAATEMNDPAGTHAVADWREITSSQVFESINPTEFSALSAAEQTRVDRILGLGADIQTAPGTQSRAELIAIFGGGSTTISTLAVIANPGKSHAGVLGIGAVVESEITQARAL